MPNLGHTQLLWKLLSHQRSALDVAVPGRLQLDYPGCQRGVPRQPQPLEIRR